MADGLARILSKQGFDSENFVKKQAVGGKEELENLRHQVQTLSDETSLALKKNVYKNYSQFIETAKEISILEGEMYQLSHMLTEQKSIMNSMMEMSLTSDRTKVEEPDPVIAEDKTPLPSSSMAYLLEKVEGCTAVMEVQGRYCVHDGDVIELDPESFIQIQKVHAFLLNDSLMITSLLPHRRSPVRYRFQALYELDTLAVVNARDVGSCKNAFKILMFPDTRMYQAETPKEKRQWLDILEDTKKKKTSLENQRKDSTDRNSVLSRNSRASKVASAASFELTNPFADDEEETIAPIPEEVDANLHADWLQEVPEDLDVFIALRDFEGAVDLVDRVYEHLDKCEKTPAVREYRVRIDHRIKQLGDVLMNELRVSPERSVRGGPRGARRAVTQLIRLGKSAQACELFLKNRSAISKYNLRQLKIEGATTLHMKKLSSIFFASLMTTGKEFMKAFPDYYGCFSAFVVWAGTELASFVDLFRRQVFASKIGLTLVAECVQEARKCCDELRDIGLELTFLLNSLLSADISKIILDNKEYQLDAIKLRAQEDNWRPINLLNKIALTKFLGEMSDMGIKNMEPYTYDECYINLSTNSIGFTKAVLTYTDDIMKLYSREFHLVIVTAFADIFRAQINYITRTLQDPKVEVEHKFILRNASFLFECVLPEVERRCSEKVGQPCKQLQTLHTLKRNVDRTSKTIGGEFL